MPLWPHQEEARSVVDATLPLLPRRSMVLQACTGAGKTRIADALRPDVVIAPGIDLVRQLQGRISGARVYTIQGLSRSIDRGEELPAAKRVVIDEGRCAAAPKWSRVLDVYLARGTEVVIIDATPATSNGHGLGQWADAIHQVSSMSALASGGYIVPYRVMASDGVVERPVDVWLRRTNGRRALLFCRNKVHAGKSAAEFNAMGIPAAVISDSTPEARRRELLGYVDEFGAWRPGLLASGHLWVLVCAQILRQGIDIPEAEAILLDRLCGSYQLFQQAIGRGGRQCSAIGKRDCYVVDMRGTLTDMHGLPSDPVKWGLGYPAIVSADGLPPPSVCTAVGCGVYGRGDTCEVCGEPLPEPNSPTAKRANVFRFVRQALRAKRNPWDIRFRYRALYGSSPPMSWVIEAVNGYKMAHITQGELPAPIRPKGAAA